MAIYIPDPVVKRLPMYYRYLKETESRGQVYISSAELAKLMGLTASQVRQDVNAFQGEGRQGCGYPVTELKKHIEKLLGICRQQNMIIVGVGNLGRALLRHKEFAERGFTTIGLFDNLACSNAWNKNLPVKDIAELESFTEKHRVDIAILTLPAVNTQAMAERLYQCGIRAFWNFAPIDVQLPKDAAVVNVHLDESLELLSYRLKHPE
ncbi:MAG: redox-sensing transcriptional repressor Rex [Clostridia bacterium]|nr:redox-sensing transcriptional repressor Rex [Clostridia bacterium]